MEFAIQDGQIIFPTKVICCGDETHFCFCEKDEQRISIQTKGVQVVSRDPDLSFMSNPEIASRMQNIKGKFSSRTEAIEYLQNGVIPESWKQGILEERISELESRIAMLEKGVN